MKHGVAWTPTIAKWLRPLSPSAERFRERENQILDDPNADLPPTVRAVTDNSYDKLFKRYTPAQLERAKIGYEKANEFIRRFVAAGGLLKEGSDPPRGMAALADASGAGDGRRGGRAADDGDPGGDAQRRQDLQEGQGLRQRRARQGRRPVPSSRAIRCRTSG